MPPFVGIAVINELVPEQIPVGFKLTAGGLTQADSLFCAAFCAFVAIMLFKNSKI